MLLGRGCLQQRRQSPDSSIRKYTPSVVAVSSSRSRMSTLGMALVHSALAEHFLDAGIAHCSSHCPH